MKYATVCSGIEAPTVAWHGLGFEPVWFSEIETFPCKLLKHHYPQVPNLGDMTKLSNHETYRNTAIDLLCGGTPCQSFSIAGLRGGLDDERGNLALEYCRILIAKRPRWFVWENVPGVFSSNAGKDFACILSAFTGTEVNPAGIGNAGVIQGELYSVAWRVLDAQYFGVPQRRRRVFVVGYTGENWRAPYAVLFEPESLRRDFTPSREKGQNATGAAESDINCTERGITGNVSKKWARGKEHAVVYSLDSVSSNSMKSNNPLSGCNISEVIKTLDSTRPDPSKNQGGNLIIQSVVYDTTQITSPQNGSNPTPELCHPLCKGQHVPLVTLAYDTADTLTKCANQTTGFIGEVCSTDSIARRLTPLECERLQGFPDNYTNIPGATGWRKAQPYETEQYCIENNLKYKVNKSGKIRIQDADGPRYAAIGNSMAVPVMRWIGERIALMDKVLSNIKHTI